MGERIKALYPVSALNDLVRYDNGVIMPRNFIPLAEKLYNFPLREDDIWVVTFPKTGTTWTQEMTWMLVNDVDKEKGIIPLPVRSPFLEMNCVHPTDDEVFAKIREQVPQFVFDAMKDPMKCAENMTGRRVLKSHMPMEFLPPDLTKKCKVIYVARTPKDTCVSFFHHMVNMPHHGFIGDFGEFAELFKDGLLPWADFWHHILSGWTLRNHPNVKFLWFEDMKKNQKEVIEDLCVFLNHELTPTQVDSLVEHLRFDNIKKNMAVNPTIGLKLDGKDGGNFMRKGQVGDWKNFFTSEKTEEWAKWIKEKTEGTGLMEKIPS